MTEHCQLELFDRASADPDDRRRLEQLAARQPGNVYLGTSSWNFRGWDGIVYHQTYRSEADFRRRSLGEYARYPLFRTVGIDRSYYAPLSTADLRHYAKLLPTGFPACLKLWNRLSAFVYPNHPMFGRDAGQINPNFLDADLFAERIAEPIFEGFLDHLGPFIVQIAPIPGVPDRAEFERRLERFLERVPEHFHFAVELRNPILLTPTYLDILRQHHASHVLSFWSAMPTIEEQAGRLGRHYDDTLVIRLLLPQGARYEARKNQCAPFDRIIREQQDMRREVAEVVTDAHRQRCKVFVLVNNKAEGSAPLTVRALATRLASDSG